MRIKNQSISQGEKLWTVGFVLICLIAIIQRTSTQMQNTALPLYIQALGFTKAAAGNANAVYSAASLILRPFMGMVVDRWGGKRVLIFGTVLLALTVLGYGFAASLGGIVLLRALGGVAFSATTVAVSTVSVQNIAESRMTEGIGYFGLSSAFAQSVGPVFALALISDNDAYWMCFVVTALLLGVATLMTFFVKEHKEPVRQSAPAREQTAELRQPKQSVWIKLVEPTAVLPSVLSFCVFFSSSAVGTFISTYTKEAAIAGVATFFVVKALTIALSRVVINPIYRFLGNEKGLLLAFAVYAANFCLIFGAKGQLTLWTAGALFGFGYGLLQTLLNAAAVINTPKSRRGAANATYYIAMDLGLGAGAACWGYVADWFGTRSIYLGAALVQAAAVVLFFVFKKVYGQFMEKIEK